MSDTLNSIVLMLVSGVSPKDIEGHADRLGLTPDAVRAQLEKAREAITLAADYNRTAEIGTAYVRLNDLYIRSLKGSDAKTALAAQKELNKLLRLYEQPSATDVLGDAEGPAAIELRQIAEHLLPLGLAPETYPLHEHCRIAADRIRQGS